MAPSRTIEPPPQVRARFLRNRLVWLGLLLTLYWASFGTEISPQKLWSGLERSWQFIVGSPERPNSGFFPPNLDRLGEYLNEMVITIKMALWGTALAALAAIPLSILASRNTAPHPLIYQLTRRVLDLFRGLNEFVLALIFVAAVGLGPFPGILALAVYTAGILGKLFSEAIEVVDPGQLEAVRASGASGLQVFTHGVWPQVLPTVISMTLYRFESNVRSATVLGLVGAGGIGLYVTESIRAFDFKAASTILLVIIVSVMLVDYLSSKLRERLT
ncbi:MAG: phosphonate ABC transporter, permease protein PhnE [Meiothermus sp.]|uniref:phosphonate ABC transporter, permease protein PhnE n=1 Tax=Meiothermus sp. TaxID=1955249 RepID=UPI0025DFFE09|nr:phosphonate ABC transporter, permease protein PhnE [Meiothermus sp.]MCS7068545.1 phosphonate ABC transporter, permease protein PhnE [Meiothermus sp.]MCX7739439.1 phosphonate ABC transporter, permease protein PhnE [Meiothermus sp.]MDW8425898.1 phosphonate ABC transporter, permease protein PhnE [Meiothermus sp.]